MAGLVLLKRARLPCRPRRNGRSCTSVYAPTRAWFGFAYLNLLSKLSLQVRIRFANGLRPAAMAGLFACQPLII